MIRIKQYFFLVMLLFLWQEDLPAQTITQRKIDSLKASLKTAKENTAKVNCFNELSWLYRDISNYDIAKAYADSAFVLADKINYKKGKAEACNNFGVINNIKGNYPQALKNYSASLKLSEEIKDRQGIATSCNYTGEIFRKQGNYPEALKNHLASLTIGREIGDQRIIASSYNNIGIIYDIQGAYSEALNNYLASLKINKDIGDKQGIAFCYDNIGLIYKNQGNYPEALKNYLASFKIAQETGDNRFMAISYQSIGKIYENQRNYPEALKNYSASLKIAQAIGDKRVIANSYNHIGMIYKLQNNYQEALSSFFTALKIFEEIGHKRGIAGSYNNIGNILSNQGNYAGALRNQFISLKIYNEIGDKERAAGAYINTGDVFSKQAAFENFSISNLKYTEALYFFKKGLLLAKETGTKDFIKDAYRGLTEAYKGMGDYKKALEYHQLYIEIKDSLINNESTHKLEQLRTQYEVEKAVAVEKEQNEKLLEEQKFHSEKTLAERKRKNELMLMGLGILGIVSVFSFLLIRQRNLKRRAIERSDTVHKMAELELQSLRAQLNPHFMFNSLNAIQDLILKEDNYRSHLYLSRFSKLLRMLLDNADQPFVSVKQEIEFLELYLSLENLRITDLQFSIEKDPKINTEERMVPNMMLQPYIENAIWHGLSHKKENRKLQIRIHETENATEFEIEDNGVGRQKAEEMKSLYRKRHHSKGMELLSRRFNLLSKEYGEAIQTSVTDLRNNGEATGTLVKIDVPFSLSEQAKQLTHDTNHHN